MRVTVVGAGVAGCHAALTLLERGHEVDLWDVGRDDPVPALPGVGFHALKDELPQPVEHFLGTDLRALVPPVVPELLRYPPSRNFLAAADDPLLGFAHDGFHPYASLATGGLANGWGANALAYDDDDLAGWPVSSSEMDAAYRTAFARVPVAGPAHDDLSPHLRGVQVSQPALPLSTADRILLDRYAARRSELAARGIVIGHARMAVVTDPARPDACDRCDRCLWGCPRGAIYNPARSTLAACAAHARFRHLRGRLVISLAARDGRVTALRYLDIATDTVHEQPCELVVLAAGALQTGAIFLRTLHAAHPHLPPRSAALMDTAVVKLPYVCLRAIGRPADERSFQFNRLLMGLVGPGGPGDETPRYLHAELLHLTSLVYHPLIERMPFDTRTAARLFFALRSALGVVTLFMPDRPADDNHQLLADTGGRWPQVTLRYRETPQAAAAIDAAAARMRAALRTLGCVPRGVARSPAGGGIHYAGTVPMGDGAQRCGADGRSNAFANLYIGDGAAFPTLPSKSITMSLAAHAIRVAGGLRR
ncbi:MAG: GMC family oxidoreductase [Burkholderiales bacterium]|nr:GMC family oxidoreductase [Burkholderiales bacterium]